MKYVGLLLKKVRKDNINAIPFLLVMIFIVIMYIGNYKSAYQNINDPDLSGENEVEFLKNDIKIFEEELKTFDIDSEDYRISNDNLKMAKNRLYYMQGKVNAIKNKNWTEYYKNDAELTRITINVIDSDSEYRDIDVMKLLETNMRYNEYMMDYNLAFDYRFVSTQGISYMSSVLDKFFPIMLVILIIFILSKMYCSNYIYNIDIHDVLPYSSLKKQCLKLSLGTVLGLCIASFIFIVSILCGTIGNAMGDFTTPILTYTAQGADVFSPFYSFIPEIMILIFLSILFITNFVSVVSKVTRKNMACLLLSLGILLGCLIVLQDIAPLQKYMHISPTTYVNAFKVVSGELASSTHNADITFSNGVIVLLFTNCLLFILDICLSKSTFWRMKVK